VNSGMKNKLRSINIVIISFCILLSLFFSTADSARAEDWPQWRGPDRDGISKEKGLLTSWPDGGPEKLWSVSGLGQGFSTVAVVDNTIYATGMDNKKGYLFRIGTDGKLIGKTKYGREVDSDYPGARSTPTVNDGMIYVMSGYGVVSAFDASSGEIVWQIDTFAKFGGRDLGWHISESLLIDGDNLICTPGGSTTSIVALNKKTGETVWTNDSVGQKSAYCSPVVEKIKGTRTIITMLEKGVFGFDAESGKKLWSYKHEGNYGIHAATPIYKDGAVFITSGYRFGGRLVDISKSNANEAWFTKDLANHHGGVVLLGSMLLGTNDRGFVAVDWKSGKTLWTERLSGKGSLVVADDLVYGYGENGTVALIAADKNGGKMISNFHVEEGDAQHWAHPVVSGGVLYIRHGDVLIAYSVTK